MSIWFHRYGRPRPIVGRRRTTAAALVLVLAVAAVPGQAAADSANEQRLRRLEDALRKQSQRIEELDKELEKQKAIGQARQELIDEVNSKADAAKKASGDVAKKTAGLGDWVNRTTVFGDVRVRHEGFYHQPHAAKTAVGARNRDRFRARLGIRVAYSDELSATVRAATGNINDPISTNETFTGVFNRKNFNLDQAYITFTPGKTFDIRPGLASVSAGKLQNPIFKNDELVFDEDVSPEGFSETFQLLDKPLGPLDQVKVHGLQWNFSEIANKQDGWMFGGQVNPALHVGNVQLEAGLGQFWWLNPDQIAQALSRNTTASTAAGAPVANGAFNSSLVNTNLLVTKTIQPRQLRPGTTPAAFTAISGYQSGFNQSNFTLAATVPNVVAAQPLKLWTDYVYNWDAVNDDAHGILGGLRLGQTKAKGDWSIYGFYEHLDQEATISSFTSSEFGTQGTNLKGPSVGIDYQLLNPLTISARSYFTNFINRPAGSTNPTLTRFQLDALVRF
jgi:hypothetical protein